MTPLITFLAYSRHHANAPPLRKKNTIDNSDMSGGDRVKHIGASS